MDCVRRSRCERLLLPTYIADPNGYSATFSYAPDRSRWKQVSTYAGGSETTIYVGGLLEKLTAPTRTHWKHLVPTPSGQVQVIRRSDGTKDTFYVTTDHLGSTDAVLNAAGTVLMRGSFGVHGARRASNWQGAPKTTEWQAIANTTRRGYTGHEQIDNVLVVHMNGRVFDPNIGRFLSADPYIDGPETTQGWNRYAYVRGRVLSATDPTGYDYLGNLATTTASRCVDSWSLACNVNLDPNFLNNLMANSSFFGQPTSPLLPSSGASTVAPTEPTEVTPEQDEPQSEPPPCEYGPSTASGAVTGGGYAGPGLEVTTGLHNGHSFATVRTGFGFGGGASYNPRGGIPIRPADHSHGGVITSASLQFGASAGVPGTTLAASLVLEFGAAYSSRDGFGWIANFDPELGALSDKGLRGSGSVGGQLTVYDEPVTTITNTGTCRAQW